MKTLNFPNSTETMAERAWRYGIDAEPHQFEFGVLLESWVSADGSRLYWNVPFDRPELVIDAGQGRRSQVEINRLLLR